MIGSVMRRATSGQRHNDNDHQYHNCYEIFWGMISLVTFVPSTSTAPKRQMLL